MTMEKHNKFFSMTGFSRVSGNYLRYSWYWELKSVNGKGLDVRCRLPQGTGELELVVREKVGKCISRGNINMFLSLKEEENVSSAKINKEFLDTLIAESKIITSKHKHLSPVTLDGLLAVKGVVEPVEHVLDDKEVQRRDELILTGFEEALRNLLEARGREGEKTLATLGKLLDEINELIKKSSDILESQPNMLRESLEQKVKIVQDVNTSLSEERILQEVALLLIKGDVSEEVERLRAHTGGMRELLVAGGVVGRKLDFLCQELNREANTLCSKANNIKLSNIGLEIKALIEKIREQVQNIE